MKALSEYEYIAVVQCHIVKERCSGFLCEKAFHRRTGGFAELPADKPYRIVYFDCGGCCGKAVLRKLQNLKQQAARDGIPKEKILVQLSSCITKDNYHSPRCPTAGYIRELVDRAGLDCREDTVISAKAQRRRQDGTYKVTQPAPEVEGE